MDATVTTEVPLTPVEVLPPAKPSGTEGVTGIQEGAARLASWFGLTAVQARIAVEFAMGGDLAAAAKAAGASTAYARQLLGESEAFQKAVLEHIQTAKAGDVVEARTTIYGLMRAAKTSDKVKLDAARLLLAYAIGQPLERVAVAHDHRMSLDRDELRRQITSIAAELGIRVDLHGGLGSTASPAALPAPVAPVSEYVPALPPRITTEEQAARDEMRRVRKFRHDKRARKARGEQADGRSGAADEGSGTGEAAPGLPGHYPV